MKKRLLIFVALLLCGFMLLTAVAQADSGWGRRRHTPTPHFYYPCVYAINGKTPPYPHC